MRPAAILCCALSLLPAAAGCRNTRGELVEAELRTKERMLREAREELERTRLVNEALEHEFIRRQQGCPPGAGTSGVLPPKDITLANGTGGLDEDLKPGDEALMVVVLPRDEDRNPVRAVGTLTVTAWEIMPGGVKVPLGTWEVNSTDLRKTWKSGLIGSGFFVTLAWTRPPTQERLRVAARLVLPDGRTYEADKDVNIRPLPGAAPPPIEKMPSLPVPAPEPGPGPPIPDPPPAVILPPVPSTTAARWHPLP
jgi:hypothetical protein